MPHLGNKLHLGRRKRIVLWKAQFSGEDAAFKRRVFWALDQRFPDEHVIFVYGSGGYTLGRVRR